MLLEQIESTEKTYSKKSNVNSKFRDERWSDETIKFISRIINQYSYINRKKIASIYMDADDFKQEILTKMLHQNGYSNFDPKKKSLKNYMYDVCYRTLGDNVRKKHKKSAIPETISLDMELNEDGFNLSDILISDLNYNSNHYYDVLLTEYKRTIPNKRIWSYLDFTYVQLFNDYLDCLNSITLEVDQSKTDLTEEAKKILINKYFDIIEQIKADTKIAINANNKMLSHLQNEYKLKEIDTATFESFSISLKLIYVENMQKLSMYINSKNETLSFLKKKLEFLNTVSKTDFKKMISTELNELHDYLRFYHI